MSQPTVYGDRDHLGGHDATEISRHVDQPGDELPFTTTAPIQSGSAV